MTDKEVAVIPQRDFGFIINDQVMDIQDDITSKEVAELSRMFFVLLATPPGSKDPWWFIQEKGLERHFKPKIAIVT